MQQPIISRVETPVIKPVIYLFIYLFFGMLVIFWSFRDLSRILPGPLQDQVTR